MLKKTKCNYGYYYAVLSEDFCVQKIPSLKFMQIFADDQITFCLVLHFFSLVATIRMYYHNLECRNTTV